MRRFTSIELCAGAGGQALGIEEPGFHHKALIELDPDACATLRLNRLHWNVIEDDLWRAVEGKSPNFKPELRIPRISSNSSALI